MLNGKLFVVSNNYDNIIKTNIRIDLSRFYLFEENHHI